MSHASNVIIRNLNFKDSSDDAINVEGSKNVWIDHNSLSNAYDGAIDIKRGSDYVTVSWNHISDQNKSMLLGHSDDNGAQDRGHLRVTYDHNWFEGDQRSPRVRFGNPVHVYNNYYDGVSKYGVASTEGAGVLVEGNDFEGTKDPYHRGEAASSAGSLVARNNQLVDSGKGDAGGSVAAIPYTYSVDPASDVKSIVTAGAGAGKSPCRCPGRHMRDIPSSATRCACAAPESAFGRLNVTCPDRRRREGAPVMSVGLQVFVGVVAGTVMLTRLAVAVCQAWFDGQVVAERARREAAVRNRLPERSLR